MPRPATCCGCSAGAALPSLLAAVIELPRWQAQFLLPAEWGGAATTTIFMAREDYDLGSRYLDRFVAPGDVVVDAAPAWAFTR